jgi:hypothetical protein
MSFLTRRSQDQFITFGGRDELSLLPMVPIPLLGDRDPVADRLRGRFKLSRRNSASNAGLEPATPEGLGWLQHRSATGNRDQRRSDVARIVRGQQDICSR